MIVQPTLKAIDLDDMIAPHIIHKSSNKIKAPIIIGDRSANPFELFIVMVCSSSIIMADQKKKNKKKGRGLEKVLLFY